MKTPGVSLSLQKMAGGLGGMPFFASLIAGEHKM